jgi:cytohesin
MKTNWLVGSVFLAGTMVLRAQTNDLSAALRQGLFEEEANRNLDAAISNYQSLAAQFDKDRQVAATAIFRLGECYRKLGQTNDAVVQYQRILREFPDQKTLATLSRQNLAGLGTTPQASSPSTTTSESTAKTAELETEAAALKTQIERLSSLKREDRRTAIQQNFPNPVLTTLMQQLNEVEQNLASLTNDYAPTDLHVARVTAQLNAINGQIDSQVDGVIKGLQAKMEADLNAAKTFRDQSGPVPAARAEASAATDDEDQEIRRIQQLIQNSPDLINPPASHGFTPLGNAARNGQAKVATFLLDHGAGINVAQSAGVTALHGATGAGNRAMVELLLSRGADVNSKEVTEQTPLHIAANKGFQAVVEVLLANKADVNAQDNSGNTPLHLVAGGGQVKIIQMLLAAGANPNAENKEERTPLSFAAESGSLEIVKILLAAKADPNGGKLDAPLLCAIHKNDAAVVELLLQAGANPNAKGEDDGQPSTLGPYGRPVGRGSETPLSLAVSTKQLPMVQLLLKFKADPNDSRTDGQPLLFSALSDTNILKALLDAGTDPNQVGADGEPPLMKLYSFSESSERNVAFAKLLVAHGAKVNVPDNRGNTPLDVAVFRGDHELIKLLLANEADVNARRPSDGATVLHLAVQSGNREIVELLLTNKADVNARNNDGLTPLDLVKNKLLPNAAPSDQTNASGIAALLRQHGALDNLPHWDRITVSRPSANYSQMVFKKGTNDWNRFTLLETLLNFYPEQSPRPVPGAIPQPRFGTHYSETSLPFPDLTCLTIIRHKQNTTNETRIKVNLLNATNGIDCTKDVLLEFGDVVEIPEREHALGDQPTGLTPSQSDAIVNALKGSVRLVVHGGKVELSVYPDNSSLIGSVLNRPEAQGILLSSSDLSRVKVTRPDPATGQKREWVINCTPSPEAVPAGRSFSQRLQGITERSRSDGQFGAAPDLWLRDGDVIEVPEKP